MAALAGCGAATTPEPRADSPSTPGLFADSAVAFTYPKAWAAAEFEVVSSFSTSIVYLSTAPLAGPCIRTASSRQCGMAVKRLDPNGIYAVWIHRGFPTWTFDATKGTARSVGGRRATVERFEATTGCASIGGERSLLVTIEDPAHEFNWTEIEACVRGPNLKTLDGQVEAMLDSVRWET